MLFCFTVQISISLKFFGDLQQHGLEGVSPFSPSPSPSLSLSLPPLSLSLFLSLSLSLSLSTLLFLLLHFLVSCLLMYTIMLRTAASDHLWWLHHWCRVRLRLLTAVWLQQSTRKQRYIHVLRKWWIWEYILIHLSLSLSLSLPILTEEWATKVALLKRNCFAAVFEKYFDLQVKGGEKSTAIVHYRDQETM